MSDPVSGIPRELELIEPAGSPALSLLRIKDFRTLFLAVSVSELGDALNYIALMWVALERGGPLGVVAVRLADSIPALLFGLHGGIAADRWSRRKLMVGADLARGATLVPVAVLGLSGSLPLWGLVVAAFLLETATSYFEPAYGATIPAVVERKNVQGANALVQATAQGLSIGGWALAALLLAVLPLSTFFAIDAATFFLSAAFILRIRAGRGRARAGEAPRLREGLEALRPRRALATAVVTSAIAMTITTGCWIAGVPTLVEHSLHEGAGGFAIVMIGFAIGSIGVGILLARMPVRRKARASMLAWVIALPAYLLLALAGSVSVAVGAAVGTGAAESMSDVLLNSAAQEEIPDEVLGRVLGVISFVHRGSHATGLLLVSPLFAIAAARPLFAIAAFAVAIVGLGGAAVAARLTRRGTAPLTA
ncbi:MAG TPA: MFS transporter [Gaiellaceae bacterium]|jgi:MFS family permease|nr:MFS transporter [Gaiellaceae bacterium]